MPIQQDDGPELDDDPYVGQTLADRFKVIQCLGEGAMGVVYYGQDLKDGSVVAIKMMSDSALERHSDQGDRLVERFKREIETTKKLNHPHIVEVLHDGETTDGMPFVVLEYLEGWDLREILDDERRLSPERAAAVGQGVALALAHSHAQGVVHRDLKPENIFLVQRTDAEFTKVLDFGIARATAEDQERLTVAGTALGTPRYMAPEQVTDTGLTPATDVYSFGVLLFEMLSGTLPFWTENELDMALMHVHEKPAALDVEGMEVELLAGWSKLIERMLQKKPADRPGAAEVATELQMLHTFALANAEVDHDKETQILRLDVAAERLKQQRAGTDKSRPTRVLGVRMTRSGANKATATAINRLETNILQVPPSVAASDTSLRAASQRAKTDTVGGDFHRAATEQVDSTSDRSATVIVTTPPPKRAGTNVIVVPVEPEEPAPSRWPWILAAIATLAIAAAVTYALIQ